MMGEGVHNGGDNVESLACIVAGGLQMLTMESHLEPSSAIFLLPLARLFLLHAKVIIDTGNFIMDNN